LESTSTITAAAAAVAAFINFVAPADDDAVADAADAVRDACQGK
jgi:hypothetical protein